jgi:hypothetical protein
MSTCCSVDRKSSDMIAKTLGVTCSKKCELVLALAFIKAPEELVQIAYRLATDADASAIRLARMMINLSPLVTEVLAKQTLRRAGYDVRE